MADLLFKCHRCSKHHVIDGSASGKMVKCDGCGQRIQVPGSARPFKCPSCFCELSASHVVEGTEFHCPSCKSAFTVPATPTTRIPDKRTEGW